MASGAPAGWTAGGLPWATHITRRNTPEKGFHPSGYPSTDLGFQLFRVSTGVILYKSFWQDETPPGACASYPLTWPTSGWPAGICEAHGRGQEHIASDKYGR